MKQRSIPFVIIMCWLTLGIYYLAWLVMTKREMVRCGAKIPTAWLLLVPIVNLWWMWRYSVGVEYVSRKRLSGAVAFIVLVLANGSIPGVGHAILQDTFNKLALAQPQAELPTAQVL